MLAKLVAGPLAILYWGIGLWGFLLVAQYIYQSAGMVGVFLSFIVFPAAYGLVPLWAGFVDGYWMPAIVCYSPIALAAVLAMISGLFDGMG